MFNGILFSMAVKLCVKNAQLLLFIMKLFVYYLVILNLIYFHAFACTISF